MIIVHNIMTKSFFNGIPTVIFFNYIIITNTTTYNTIKRSMSRIVPKKAHSFDEFGTLTGIPCHLNCFNN